jgi:hypothetical protein
MNIDDKLKVFLNDWTSWRMKTKLIDKNNYLAKKIDDLSKKIR